MKIATFDTTLRDGAQAEKISFSVADKIKIVKILDDLGVDYIEAGNPASNVKDLAFFKELQKLPPFPRKAGGLWLHPPRRGKVRRRR